MKNLSVIVPYRDRKEHLSVFVPYMEKFLISAEIDFKIFIIEQDNSRPFNRAKLLNVGFDISKDFDYFVFHDVDMLPIDSDYSYPDGPTHLATEVEQFGYKLPYPGYFGGVTIFDKSSFLKINGYSNEYWGWGAEDDDVLLRCRVAEIMTFRKNCRYKSLSHARNINNSYYNKNLDKLNSFSKSPTIQSVYKDGLNTLNYIKEDIIRISEKSNLIKVKI
jgi:predicted glycosyltransferase involved in capsule biosynthesis